MRIQLACLCGTTLTGEATGAPDQVAALSTVVLDPGWALLHDGLGHGPATLSIARAIRRAHERGQLTTPLVDGTLPEADADAGTDGTPGTAAGPTAASSTSRRAARAPVAD